MTNRRSTLGRPRAQTPLRRLFRHWFSHKIGVPLAYFVLRALHWTWRIERKGDANSRLRPAIFAIWHGDLVVGAQELPHLLPKVDVLASRSRDGALVARYVHLFRAKTIRGGSSKGGAQALRQMRGSLLRGYSIVIPIDGPRGPRGRVKPGVIAVASQTGTQIVPGVVLADRAWRMTSWDKAFVAKPFARVQFIYDDPQHVEPDATREQIEAARLRLEQRLFELHGMEWKPEPKGTRSD
jgi:lysophospholipid acyltransferase (LPLAT)-like uncharacterized protein